MHSKEPLDTTLAHNNLTSVELAFNKICEIYT